MKLEVVASQRTGQGPGSIRVREAAGPDGGGQLPTPPSAQVSFFLLFFEIPFEMLHAYVYCPFYILGKIVRETLNLISNIKYSNIQHTYLYF